MTSPDRARREIGRFLKFSVVGVIGAVVDFGAFNLLTLLAHLPGIPSSAVSFAAAVTSNFLWNRYWTYPDSRAKPVRRQATQFALVNLAGLAIRTPIYAAGESLLVRALQHQTLPFSLDPTQTARNLALAIAVVIVLFWNYGVNRLWTYSDVR